MRIMRNTLLRLHAARSSTVDLKLHVVQTALHTEMLSAANVVIALEADNRRGRMTSRSVSLVVAQDCLHVLDR